MLVIDASAAAELLLGRPPASAVAEWIEQHDADIHAPHLIDIEVLSVLRRLAGLGSLSTKRAGQALDDFRTLPIERYGHEPFLERAWDLRANFSPYDAMYVALAEALAVAGAPLLTADRRLARAVGRHSGTEVLLAA